MQVVLVTSDLTVISRVDAAAARIGAAVSSIAGSDAEVVARSMEMKPDMVVIDLGAPLDVKSLVEQIRGATPDPPRFVAFGPHVHVDRLQAARDAGCDAVLSRGQFLSQIDSVLNNA
jgi:AmiR/NasT family two-component response regulator